MSNLSQMFSDDQRKQIEQVVHDAEAKTSCEIVPVVVTSSGRYDRAEDMVGFWFAVVSAIAVWVLLPRQSQDLGSWGSLPVSVELLTLVCCLVGAFVIGTFAGSRIDWLKRLFTPRQQMKEEVAQRAREIFFDQRIHHTRGSTGLLIYISLFEHRAAVLGDQKILETLGQASLDQLCQQLVGNLRGGEPSDAICGVVAEAGNLLSGLLPRLKDDVNEFQDALVLIEN